MTRRLLVRVLAGWAAGLALACLVVQSCARIDPAPMPDHAARMWALDALDGARFGREIPPAPASARAYRAEGPIVVHVWSRGRSIGRHVHWEAQGPSLERAVRDAARAFAADDSVTRLPGWRIARGRQGAVEITIDVALGESGLVRGIPYLSAVELVPLRDGLIAREGERLAVFTPDDLRAQDAYDANPTPLPDLSFGTDLDALIDQLARELGLDVSELDERGEVRRARFGSITRRVHPARVRPTEQELRRAAVEGARFLLRHQRPDGSFTYIYDARNDRPFPGAYNYPRHAGTLYFLAQVHHIEGNLPEAREGALRALRWVLRRQQRECGDPSHWCIESYGRVEVGSAALLAVAAAEILETGDDPLARRALENLTAWLRAQQREDGELMHEYDLAENRPIDVQHLYYSGEAALALLRAHAVLGDERNLRAARRLMGHLTGAGWSFLGSRYYYGEEHWTCISAGEASTRFEVPEALDFCLRWAEFNRELQYREGQTHWPVSGAYGVGPLLVPRLTPVASRSEAFISTWQMAKRARVDRAELDLLRGQIERGLGMLLRWRFDPGPTHLMSNPFRAQGGIPGSPTELQVRNDYVQHACSAMVRWADELRRMREGGRDQRPSDAVPGSDGESPSSR